MVKLAEVAHSCGAVIVMEDMTLPCLGNSAEELLEMISDDDKLRICFDTNHLFNNTHEEFVRLLGDKIVTVHLSDYTETGEKHWFPGEGIVDWPEIPKLLKSVGYNGVWLYELSLNGAKSADRGRPLTFRDFRRNADEIFAGKKPTVIAAHHRAAFPLWQVFDLREARDFLSKREYALYRQMVDAILDHSGTVENLESEEEFHKIWSLLLAEFVPSRAMGGLQNTPQKGKSVNSERSWPICLFAVNLNG